MKVLDLRCEHGHGFEGWFGSEDDFQAQLGRGLVTCPLCGSQQVGKLPSAPRLNLSGAQRAEPAATATAAAGAAASAGAGAAGGKAPAAPAGRSTTVMPADLQAAWVKAVQHVMQNTEDVGERFPEEARRIHYGEVPQRGIRGQATPEQRAALAEEGVEVMALPVPEALKGPVQ